MAGYLVKKPIKALSVGLSRNPGQQVSDAEVALYPGLLRAWVDEGIVVPVQSDGLNSLMKIEGMRHDWASVYYAFGFRTPADIAGASVDDLRRADGVGPAKANELKAAAGVL